MLTLLPLGSAAQPQSPRGIQLQRVLEKEPLKDGKIDTPNGRFRCGL